MSDPEKPWYTPTIVRFLTDDVPRLTGISRQHFDRDVHTLCHRLSAEGESFLTKTLPAFGKSIDLALQGHTPLVTPHFRKRGRSALPAFLSALLRRVFMDDGWVRSEPCITSVRLLRQLTLWCKKLKKGYSDESLQKAAEDFINVDAVLPACRSDLVAASGHLAIARAVIERIFRDIGSPAEAAPRHGPGAVAGGEGVVGKRWLGTSYTTLERVFRPIPWFYSLRDAAESPERIYGRPKYEYGLSKTAFVEKDSSGPRTIGLEPAEYMWCQQAVKNLMYNHLEKHRITKGHVNFTDQTINRELARDWSRFETLDMSKASDRNSYVLVKELFGRTKLWPWLDASRTPGTVLPDGRVLLYRKFAPMGSAVCFPVQACVYFALAVAAQHLAGMPLFVACRKTYVYGDDIIVPRGQYPVLERAFESVGLKFNADKCCTEGRFRESCGLDAYDGIEVTPVRMRLSEVDDPVNLVTVVEHSNQLYDAGYWSSAEAHRTASLAHFPDLRKLRLAQSHRVLPFLVWRSAPEDETVRYKWKDGIMTARGWVFKPKSLESPPELEVKHLRESLSRGGPVGRWIRHPSARRKPGQRRPPPESQVRVLDARFVGRLRQRVFKIPESLLPEMEHPQLEQLLLRVSASFYRKPRFTTNPRNATQ